MYCRYCGKKIHDRSRYCIFCGRTLPKTKDRAGAEEKDGSVPLSSSPADSSPGPEVLFLSRL